MPNPAVNLPGRNLPLSCYDLPLGSIDNFYGRDSPRPWEDDEDVPQHSDGYRIIDETHNWFQLRRTELEIAMIHVMNTITDKPRWEEKIQNPVIRERWRVEICRALSAADTRIAEQSRDLRNGPFYWGEEVDRKAAQFILEELEHRSRSSEGFATLLGLGGADVIKSDTHVPEDFRVSLVSLISPLEQGPADWHPGRENVVRNLVHPSMYPLQYGKTKFCPDQIPKEWAFQYFGQGETLPEPEEDDERNYSTEFQWLPAEVRGDRSYVFFDSYINNLDPSHEELYAALGELVRISVPLWEKCIATRAEDAPRRVPCDDEELLWTAEQNKEEPPPFARQDVPAEFDGDKARELLVQMGGSKWYPSNWAEVKPVLVWPAPDDFSSWKANLSNAPMPPTCKLMETLARHGLQVIVKIASIHLTPENPSYQGGAMHVEGLPNEHICATSIYYFESENIGRCQVAFSGGASMMYTQHHQDSYHCLEHVYGTSFYQKPAIQQFGTVATPQGRLLVFPNVFQHQLLPFELLDKSKPGHRKVVVLWLVNPQKRIISTAHVPPQQLDMYEKMVNAVGRDGLHPAAQPNPRPRSGFMTRDEANAARLRLMSERRHDGPGPRKTQRLYSFCEH